MKFTLLRTAITLLSILMLQVSLFAQDQQLVASNLSLKQAQEYAIQNNINAKNSAIDLEIAKKKIWETISMGLPQISAQANYQHLFKVPELSLGGTTFLTTDLPAGVPITAGDILNERVYLGFTPSAPIQLGVKDNTTLDITLSQLIFSGEYIVGLQATKVFYEMTNQNQQKTIIDLKENIANIYCQILVLEQTRNYLNTSLDNTNKTLSEMKEMFSQGIIENTDVDQLEYASFTLVNSVSIINRQIDAMYDLLKYQIGMKFSDKIILTDELDSISDKINLETIAASKFNINNNLDYQILTTGENISKLNLKREKSSYLPSLIAVYRHSEKVNQPQFDFTPKDVFQLSMSIPIFSSGMRMVKVQQRQLELKKAVNLKNDVENGLQLAFINARNDLTAAYENYLNDKRKIELTKRIYEKTLIKFNEGLSSSKDITDTQAQFLSSQNSLYNSIFVLITAKNRLDKLNNNL